MTQIHAKTRGQSSFGLTCYIPRQYSPKMREILKILASECHCRHCWRHALFRPSSVRLRRGSFKKLWLATWLSSKVSIIPFYNTDCCSVTYFSYSSFLHPFASSFVSEFGSFISPYYAVAENKYNKKKVNKRNEKQRNRRIGTTSDIDNCLFHDIC